MVRDADEQPCSAHSAEILSRFTDRLMPWVHYIPIQADYSDLWDAFVFFRGDLKGDNNHEDLARKIASAGWDWSRTFWRKEDMTAYNYRFVFCLTISYYSMVN